MMAVSGLPWELVVRYSIWCADFRFMGMVPKAASGEGGGREQSM